MKHSLTHTHTRARAHVRTHSHTHTDTHHPPPPTQKVWPFLLGTLELSKVLSGVPEDVRLYVALHASRTARKSAFPLSTLLVQLALPTRPPHSPPSPPKKKTCSNIN